MVRLVGDLGEDAVRTLVELEAVERDREVVLRELLVALVVARLTLVDAIESGRGIAPLLAVEEALRLRGLLRHLTGDRRRTRVGGLRGGLPGSVGRRPRLVELDRIRAASGGLRGRRLRTGGRLRLRLLRHRWRGRKRDREHARCRCDQELAHERETHPVIPLLDEGPADEAGTTESVLLAKREARFRRSPRVDERRDPGSVTRSAAARAKTRTF